MDIYRITEHPIQVDEAVTAISDPRAGGHALFLGTVRDQFEGRASRGLTYEAYRALAEKEMGRIGQALKERYGVLHVVMIHRVGMLQLEDVAVLVAVCAAHRTEAFQAAKEAIDLLKSKVPIWKQEHWADGSAAWHHDRDKFSDGFQD